MDYNYNKAFSRNLGWFSKEEQKIISEKVIAIPGMGGVGGHHLHTLARIGFRKFKIADFDDFDLHNFNRQIGANLSTIGKNKAQVMKELVLDIIPNAEIYIFSEGVKPSNYSEFLKGVDVLVDGLDVYVIRPRMELYDLALSRGIYVITAGPLGMGTSLISFHPDKINFSRYFDFKKDMSDEQLLVRFLAGVAPTPLHFKYMYHRDEIDIHAGKVPSLHTGALAATTAVGAEVTKIVLNRGNVRFAPWSRHYDFYYNKLKNNWRPGGNKNPMQRILIKILTNKFKQLSSR